MKFIARAPFFVSPGVASLDASPAHPVLFELPPGCQPSRTWQAADAPAADALAALGCAAVVVPPPHGVTVLQFDSQAIAHATRPVTAPIQGTKVETPDLVREVQGWKVK